MEDPESVRKENINMGNMSYCRFQNTLHDLRDCYENLDDQDLYNDEKEAKSSLIQLCTKISGEYSIGFDVGLDERKIDYDDNTLSDVEFEAYCLFEEACEDSEYEPMAFHNVKNELKEMGYDGVDLYETLAKIVNSPVVKQYVENGTIADREDLESVLSAAGKRAATKELSR